MTPVVSGERATATWLTGAAGLLVLAAAVAFAWLRHAPEPPVSRQPVVLWHTSVTSALAPGATFVANQAAISPDGETIVYTDSTFGWQLMRKRRNVAASEAIEGTQGAVSPFFSPDGAWLGFVTLDGWCVIRDPQEPAADRHLILEAIAIDDSIELEALLADG